MTMRLDEALREANKRIVRQWLCTLNGDDDAIRGSYYVVSPSLHWTLIGSTPISGTFHGLEEVLSKFQYLCWNGDGRQGSTRQGLDPAYGVKPLHIEEVTALEDGRVLVHCRSDGMGRNGLPYRNEYCWIVTITGSLISHIYEFADTAQIETVMFDKRIVPAEELGSAA